MPIDTHIVEQFQACMAEAREAGEVEPTAMTLATMGLRGGVSARTVLLKAFDERGLVFYTNLESNKGQQIRENPEVALVFHWKSIQRQVLVEGRAEPVTEAEADAYFASRPRGSQLGAWASRQSEPLKSRAELLKRVVTTEARYVGREVPRPPYWSGYRVVPHMIEFWSGQDSRLHDRFRYTLDEGAWIKQRLYP